VALGSCAAWWSSYAGVALRMASLLLVVPSADGGCRDFIVRVELSGPLSWMDNSSAFELI